MENMSCTSTRIELLNEYEIYEIMHRMDQWRFDNKLLPTYKIISRNGHTRYEFAATGHTYIGLAYLMDIASNYGIGYTDIYIEHKEIGEICLIINLYHCTINRNRVARGLKAIENFE